MKPVSKLENILSILSKGRKESVVEKFGDFYYISVMFGNKTQANKAKKDLETLGVSTEQKENKLLVEESFSQAEVQRAKAQDPKIFWSVSLV